MNTGKKKKIKLDPILLSDPMYAGVRYLFVLSLFQDDLSEPFPDRQNGTGKDFCGNAELYRPSYF